MTALLPGPQIEIEVALGLGRIASQGVWDQGRWDASVWGQTDTDLGDWVDVSCYVTNNDGVQLAAGASDVDGVVTRWEAATCAFTLIGSVFDPRSGPWAGVLGPGLPVRVRWRPIGSTVWLTAFQGFIDDSGLTYQPKTTLAKVAATDGTRIFAAWDPIARVATGAGDTAAQRIARIADMVGWPAAQRDITAGGVLVQATALSDNAWSMMLVVADTDLAIMWLTRDGRLAYRPQGKVSPLTTPIATVKCADDDATIKPVDIVGQQPTIMHNIVSVSRTSTGAGDTPPVTTLTDAPSVARYFPHKYSRTDLIHQDDAWSARVAQAVLTSSAWPSTAPESVSLNSRVDLASTALLLALEPSQLIAVDDGVETWNVEPAGWSVNVHRDYVAGDIQLLDVSIWLGSGWDASGWDDDRWGF